MKKIFFLSSIILTLIQIIVITDCRTFSSPNSDDKDYFHNYNVKYLSKILKSSGLNSNKNIAKNVILFVGDGMSFATIAAGRVLKGQNQEKSGEETDLVFESFENLGLAKTYNTDSQVPDSAGTATAIFSGIKTTVKTIGLNPSSMHSRESDRLKTIIDWAQEKGKRTGVVTTTRITHATPSSSYAYSSHRDYECDTKVPSSIKSHFKDIARQLVENKPGNKLNVIFGGGRDFLGASIKHDESVKFSGNAEVSCNRTDGENLVKKYLSQFDNNTNVKYVTNSGQLSDVDYDEVDHVMGLFANNHMSYDTLRRTDSDGEPSLTEMTKAAIKILNNKKNQNGYVLIVEGGKIDHAHHQNHARFALEEFVEFERAIQQAKDMTSSDETLIIVTSDHAHSMIYNGYAKRGNSILDFANKPETQVYETLLYATGPGYWYHNSNDSNSNDSHIWMDKFSTEKRNEPLYMHQSMIPMKDSVHGGEDVPVFATGPGSHLIQRVFEQCYIAYAISYASCIGPVDFMNPECKKQKAVGSSAVKVKATSFLQSLTLFNLFIIVIHRFLH